MSRVRRTKENVQYNCVNLLEASQGPAGMVHTEPGACSRDARSTFRLDTLQGQEVGSVQSGCCTACTSYGVRWSEK